MKIHKNTLSLVMDTWDDPGDYPNGLAGGPLPSYNYVEDVAGEIVVELELDDIAGFEVTDPISTGEQIRNFFADCPEEIEHGFSNLVVVKWDVGRQDENGYFHLTVEEFEYDDFDDSGDPDDEYDPERESDLKEEREEWADKHPTNFED